MKNKGCAVCGKTDFKLVVNLEWPLFRCLNCDLVQVYPLPSAKEVNRLYSGDYWKNYTPYGSQLQAHQKYFKKKVQEIKKLKKSGRLLDVGCALGTFMEAAKQEGYQVEGIDISDYAVNYCKKNNLQTFATTISGFHKKEKYDLISAFETLEHEHNPIKALNIINSLLNPKGLLIVTVPNTDTLTSKIMGKFWFGYKNKEHLFHFNKKSLNSILQKAGFTNIKITDDINRPYLFLYGLERFNFYLFKSDFIRRVINRLKKIPVIADLEINFNPWGNLIAFAEKSYD